MEYYRFHQTLVSGRVDDGRSRVEVYLERYKVLRTTPKGVWVSYWGGERFILSGARKRFACPSIEEAKESFIARKKRQISILTRQLSNACDALERVSERSTQLGDTCLLA